MNSSTKKPVLLLLLLSLLALLTGCGNDNGTNPNDTHHDHDAQAWIWAFDDDSSRVWIYDSHEGVLETSYTASAFPMMHCFLAGPATKPTVWMAKNGIAYAFTSGFDLSHGDHAHQETPVQYATVSVGANPVHMGSSPSGDTVAFANDGDMTVSIIDVRSKSVVRTVTHGSGHSSALLTGEYLITTPATGSDQTWAKMVDIARDSVLDSLTIGAGAHGDAYYAAGKKAFMAVTSGIIVIDAAKRTVTKTIPYSETGRTNFLYHGHNSSIAVGLHKTEAGTSDKLLVLDMSAESLAYLTIPGATLTWNISKGQFALSADGTVAVISDNTLPKIYHITLATKTVTTLAAPGAACAVATNNDGTYVWALDGSNISMIHADENTTENSFEVESGTDWIFATSSSMEAVH